MEFTKEIVTKPRNQVEIEMKINKHAVLFDTIMNHSYCVLQNW